MVAIVAMKSFTLESSNFNGPKDHPSHKHTRTSILPFTPHPSCPSDFTFFVLFDKDQLY